MGWNHQLDVAHDAFPEKNGELYLYGAGNESKRISFYKIGVFWLLLGGLCFWPNPFCGILFNHPKMVHWWEGGSLRIILDTYVCGSKLLTPQNGLDFNTYKKRATSIIWGCEKNGLSYFSPAFFVVFFMWVPQGNCKNFPFPQSRFFHHQVAIASKYTKQRRWSEQFCKDSYGAKPGFNGMSQGRIDHCSCGFLVYPPFFGIAGLELQ